MSRLARYLMEGGSYYIRSESFKDQKIFKMGPDCEYYLKLLVKYKLRFRVKIYAYCLTPTTAHILVCPENSSALPLFMQGVNQSYALYFNRKYNGLGKVWGQRYKSVLVNGETDLLERIKSVEFVPVKEGRTASPTEYPWSSCANRILGSGDIIDRVAIDRMRLTGV